MFLEIDIMFVAKDLARCRFVAQICVISGARTFWRASARRSDNEQNPLVRTLSIPKNIENMPTNFEPKWLKPELDIVKKPENRGHRLTDSNGTGTHQTHIIKI